MLIALLLSAQTAHASTVNLISCYGQNTSAVFQAVEMTGLGLEINGLDSSTHFIAPMPAFTADDFAGQPSLQLPAKSTLAKLESGFTMTDENGTGESVSLRLFANHLQIRGSQNFDMTCGN